MPASGKNICGGVCCLIATTVILVLIAHGVVEPTEFGVIRSKITQEIDEKNIYTGGRHYIGLWSTFITYPAVQVPIEFSDSRKATRSKLKTRTKEGLDLSLHFSLQYELIKEELPQLYRLLETDYDRVFERLARNSVLEVASGYTANAYWTKRVEIGDKMKINLDKNFKSVHARVMGFQLLKINLPDGYENEIVKTQVMKQEELTFTKLRDVSLSKQKVRNIIAAGNRAVNNLNNENKSLAVQKINQAEGKIIKTQIQYVSEALKSCQAQLKFQSPKTALLDYYKFQKIKQLDANTKNKIVYGGINVTLTQ